MVLFFKYLFIEIYDVALIFLRSIYLVKQLPTAMKSLCYEIVLASDS